MNDTLNATFGNYSFENVTNLSTTNVYVQVFAGIAMGLITISAVVGNLFVMVAIRNNKNLRTVR
jgi:hypothetical protein